MPVGWHGTWTAIVTPFLEDESLDRPALESLVEHQIREGVEGIVACGSTGEAAMLTEDEWASVVETSVRVAAGRVPVLAGTGRSSTRETIHRTRLAESLGAQGALVVTPPYVRPPQAGLRRHFEEVCASTSLPVMAYNVPSRTGGRLEAATLARLAEIPNLVAIKEASGDLRLVASILAETELPLLSGDDELTLPILALGGRGVVSVASNLVPARMSHLVRASLRGDLDAARAEFHRLLPLFRGLAISTNPVPVKTAMACVGRLSATVRPPLAPMTKEEVDALRRALGSAGVTEERAAASGRTV